MHYSNKHYAAYVRRTRAAHADHTGYTLYATRLTRLTRRTHGSRGRLGLLLAGVLVDDGLHGLLHDRVGERGARHLNDERLDVLRATQTRMPSASPTKPSTEHRPPR